MISCPQCGVDNRDSDKFCRECGTPLESESSSQVVHCPDCGAEVPPHFKFCGECGSRITPSSEKSLQDTQQSGVGPAVDKATRPPSERKKVGRLLVIQADGSRGPELPVHEGHKRLGRKSQLEALSDDPFLSPEHAILRYSEGKLWIEDISDLNGVFIRVKEQTQLAHGDIIRVGQQLIRFQLVSKSPPARRVKQGEDTEINGSWGSNAWGRLALITGPGIEGRAFGLEQSSVKIGREFGDIRFDEDGFISSEHARVLQRDGHVFLEDLGSSNGTYLKVRGQERLQTGDLVLMGQQLFQVELQ